MSTTLAPPVVAPAPVVLDFEARLALAGAEIADRLERADLTHRVNAAQPETPASAASVVTAPVTPAPVDLYPTPVAALLQRARARIVASGWCRDAARTDSGGMCLTEAIRAEARSHHDEGEARILLRRALGGGDPIPEQNRRLTGPNHAAQVLSTAAAMAARQGI